MSGDPTGRPDESFAAELFGRMSQAADLGQVEQSALEGLGSRLAPAELSTDTGPGDEGLGRLDVRQADPAAGPGQDDPAIVAARRRRERLLAELDRTKEQLSLTTRELARANAQLAAIRKATGYRTERAIRGGTRATLNRLSAIGRRTTPAAPTAAPDPSLAAERPDGPARSPADPGPVDPAFAAARSARARTAARLRQLGAGGPPIALTIVAPDPSVRPGPDPSRAPSASVAEAISLALRQVGLEAEPAAGPARVPNAEGGADLEIVLVLGPPPTIEEDARRTVRIGWLGADPGPWLQDDRVNTLDLILVADEATRAAVEANSSKAAHVIPDPATLAGAAALREALLAWLAGPQVAIHISPPTWAAATTWGDTPFGRDVQKAFERRGWPATLHVFAERESETALRADVAIHIRGVRAPRVVPGQTSVLWIISHPDMVRRDDCLPYNLVAVASDPFLAYLREWLGPDGPATISLHQATDPGRFYPEPGGEPHELLFVGSARPAPRPFLEALAGTSHDLAVYGHNWTPDRLDARHLRGEWIANEDLHRAYAAAAVTLSDSWPDMRDEGFIPNRIYDALASGGFVVSEAIPGLEAEFDGAVVAYHDQAELLAAIEKYLALAAERTALAAVGRQAVLARHTFDDRVDAITRALGALRGAGPT
jgi:hypothetical protein